MMLPRPRSPRRLLAAGLTVPVLLAAGCGDSGDDADTLRIGFIASLSGIYQSVGEDMRDGFQLYLEMHGPDLGGREVEVILADEGDGPATSLPAAEKLIRRDEVHALVGVVGGGSYTAIAPLAIEHQVPLIGTNARPDLDPDELEWLWHTSFISDEPGRAAAPYLLENVDGPIYAIGPDYQGGHDEMRGFVDAYKARGGELANPDGDVRWTPFPDTTDFIPYFSDIAATDAEAVYAFYAGRAAIDFVTQYAQSELADVPLYGVFLTEGAVLQEQGDLALGIQNVLNYAPDLDNPTNRRFVAEWYTRHERLPTTFAMASFDAAAVLDRAIASIDGEITPEAVNEGIAGVGQITSPRGPWNFSRGTHTPVQKWYMREVDYDGGELSNRMVAELEILGE